MNKRKHQKREARAPCSAPSSGWGHAYIGQTQTAFGLYLIDVLLVASALVVVARFKLEVAKLFVSTDALLVLMGINVVLLIFRAIVVAGSYSMALSGGLGPKSRTAIVMAAAMFVLVIPHAAFGYVAWTQYDLIRSVFQPGGGPVASPTTTTSPTTPGSTVPGATTTVPPTTTTTEPPPIWDGLERLNLLLIGADSCRPARHPDRHPDPGEHRTVYRSRGDGVDPQTTLQPAAPGRDGDLGLQLRPRPDHPRLLPGRAVPRAFPVPRSRRSTRSRPPSRRCSTSPSTTTRW